MSLIKKLRELFQEENIKITERVKILDSEITLNVNRIPSLEDLYSFSLNLTKRYLDNK